MYRFLLALVFLFSSGVSGKPDNKPANLSLHDLSGQRVRLRDYRGKIVVLNFWATWCGPCREEMPMIGNAQRAWSAKGIIFLAVSLDEPKTRKNIPGFLQNAHANLPVWTGATADDLEKLHLGQGVPDTVFLDEQGVVRFRVLGEIRRPELDGRLAWLVDHTGPTPEARVDNM